MGLLAPYPRKFFKKTWLKTFKLWCSANTLPLWIKKQIFACENPPKPFIIHQRSDFIIHYSLNYFRTVEDACPYRIGAVRTLCVRPSSAEITTNLKPQVSKFLKDRGVGKGKLLSRSFLSPRKNIKSHNPAFSLAQKAQRKSLAKRKRRNYGATRPKPSQVFWKKLD